MVRKSSRPDRMTEIHVTYDFAAVPPSSTIGREFKPDYPVGLAR